MGFVALIFALLIEQGWPLSPRNWVHLAVLRLADLVKRGTDAGEPRYGVIGWFIVIGLTVLAAAVLNWLADRLHPVAVFCFYVLVLYWTVGFRQFSHAFSEIQLALTANDLPAARTVLQQWLQRRNPDVMVAEAPVNEVCRLAISHALVAAHRHVFGPLFWFILVPGAVGPVLYRVAQLLEERWHENNEVYGIWAQRAYRVLDWLPLRMSAAGFAVVGNFEDAVYAWRGAVASGTGSEQRALLLATGGGALGLRVADPELEARWNAGDQEVDWLGVEPAPDALRSAVGLVWRSVILWLSLLGMLTVASWLGN
jgi:adenosylcobinamide-phosphate synthase